MSIFDLIQSSEIAAYWLGVSENEMVYPCEELFPDDKKRGISLKWIKGSKGLPVVLKTSAFDVSSVPRPRIGFDKLSADMPYFKESTYIDEELRQELNLVLETKNDAYIDSVLNKIFDDEVGLIRGARASRERMRMMALTTGIISMKANGQTFAFSYGITNKGGVKKKWEKLTEADPLEDIRLAKDKIRETTGAVITRAMCDGITWKNLRNNASIRKAMFPLTDGIGSVSDKALKQFIKDEVEVDVFVNDLRYKDENGQALKFMPSNTFVMFPDGELGKTWFGTTPAESDLMSSKVANVSIVDTGVAITTAEKADPVNVETIVSMICLPSFEGADTVYIMDTTAE